MHHLHFRYVTEQPSCRAIGRLFQLLDDMPADLRHALLRGLFVDFELISELTGEKEKQAAAYAGLKSRVQQLVGAAASKELIIYGLVCFILGNVHARFTMRLPRLIDDKRRSISAG